MKSKDSNSWNSFWFEPSATRSMTGVRVGLALVTACVFFSALLDVNVWFPKHAPASSTQLAEFFRAAELTSDARWMVSPLFVWDAMLGGTALSENAMVYRLYLITGILLALWTAFADRFANRLPLIVVRFVKQGGPGLLLWLWFVGWANRTVLIAGIVEPLLSASLAALAIAPIGSDENTINWRTTLSRRLLACQLTLIGIMTTALMLASPTWWNGTGAYALVAPVEDRLFSIQETLFETPLVYESLSFVIVLLMPVGLLLAWRNATRRVGITMVIIWSILVGMLSANVLYATTLAVLASTLGEKSKGVEGPSDKQLNHAPAGANGAETLDGGNMV